MGETASTWKVPLHSADSEHPWTKRYEEKGKGGQFRIQRSEEKFFAAQGNPTAGIEHPGVNASSVLTNPYHHQTTPSPNNQRAK
jgi:hypothetical protein